ncbi:MAG TPA: methylamine utilization protein MauJ [Methylomirabilota bacterium]|nr:methylamine utilization protein MauJ [Methylomirabilota bacterium]
MEIGFDNNCRLSRKQYLFEYQGVRFKLVQDNPQKYADHLLTVLPDADEAANDRAFAAASEFASALGWELRARVTVWESGGRGSPDSLPLSRLKPSIFTFPRIPFSGSAIGHNLQRLPQITTKEQRVALALFREARASNSDYLSFLFYWQIFEVGGGRPVRFVNRTFARKPANFYVDPKLIAQLPLGARKLGEYLDDDCRDAIAHIRRWPGKKALDLDRREERMRLAISVGVVRTFAEHYIREQLALKDSVYLVRLMPRGFPVFVDKETIQSRRVWRAYDSPRFERVFGRRTRKKLW